MTPSETPATEPTAASPRYMARASRALLVLATVTVAALLYFGHEVFIPVALALLFAMVLSNAVEGLHRLGLPRAVSAFLMLLLLVTGIGAATDALIEPAQKWLASAPTHTPDGRTQNTPGRALDASPGGAYPPRGRDGRIAFAGVRRGWATRGSDKRLRGPVGDGCNARGHCHDRHTDVISAVRGAAYVGSHGRLARARICRRYTAFGLSTPYAASWAAITASLRSSTSGWERQPPSRCCSWAFRILICGAPSRRS